MNSIFDIPEWDKNSSWEVNDIVSYNNKYYYALSNIPAGTNFSTRNFGGYHCIFEEKPHFIWSPSFNSNIKEDIRSRTIDVPDTIQYKYSDGINDSKLELDLSFKQRTDQEIRAICHFLYNRKGAESFYFMPPVPYNKMKIFICTEWTLTKNYMDSNFLKAKFEEKFN